MNILVKTSVLSEEIFDVPHAQEVKSEKRHISPLPSNSVSSIEKPMQFSVGGEASFFNSIFNSVVIYRSDGATAIISRSVLDNLYLDYFKKKITPVFAKAIRNLLNIRNHLSLQLDLECENISEDYFDKEEPKYLSEVEKIPLEKLKEEIKVLFGFTNLPFDSEDISEILNCTVDDAEKIIHQYINEV